MTLPVFGFVCLHRRPLPDGVASEAEWASTCAATGRPSAHLWQGREGFIVPRKYTSLAGWAQRPRDLHLLVRASGGGLVPQGPGVWNVSLLWPAPSATPQDTTAVYRALCNELARALARLGIDDVQPQAVQGSWCDGRFNLAVRGAKLVGTAQAWKRVAAEPGGAGVPIVLAHAVMVVTADPETLTARANACEVALGNATRYRPEALTSVARCVATARARDNITDITDITDVDDLESRTLVALAEQFARVVPPRAAAPPTG